MKSKWLCVLSMAVMAALSASSVSAQPDWTQVATTGPAGRQDAAMAYCPPTGKIVMFGGHTGNWSALADTWEWDGTAWSLQSPAHPPPGRIAPAMAYDPDHNEIVMFGGRNNGDRNNTYVWDGTDWKEVFPVHVPPGRMQHTMTHDPVRHRVLMYGGCNGYDPGQHFDDTWEWDGTDWTQVAIAGPGARRLHAMVYYPGSGRTVLFGGFYAGLKYGDTWEWNGNTWTKVSPAHSPSPRYGQGMAYHAARGTAIMHCGSGGGSETWEWDGSDWSKPTTTQNPGYRMYHAMGYDPVRQKTVLFAGWGVTMKSDTWEFGVAGPAPCPGDFNCDGQRNFDDIDPFVAALSTGQCACPNFANCDPNGDGKITFDDIDPFITVLGVPCP